LRRTTLSTSESQGSEECKEDASSNALKAHEAAYGGYTIRVKRDFGTRFQHVYGASTLWGYAICDSQLRNVMPGETWFQTVAEAARAVDIWTAVRGDVDKFWRAWKAEHSRGGAANASHGDSGAEPSGETFDAPTLLGINPELDARDFAILLTLAATHGRRTGPQVGDFVHVDDGVLRRFAVELGEYLQTTCARPLGGDSFNLTDCGVCFSGAHDPPVLKSRVQELEDTRCGEFWFFRNNDCRGYNSVTVTLPCHVWLLQR
jgi:hypothetical protein